MFGMSFSEIAIIAIVALVILGPEKLPEVARTAGKFLRQVRQLSTTFRDTIMMEAELHEEKQRKKNPASTPTAHSTTAAKAALAPATQKVIQDHGFDDYDGPLDQLDDDFFDFRPPDEHDALVHDVDLEYAQMSDPFATKEVELPEQLPGQQQPDDHHKAHLANPFDVHLVERKDVALPATSGASS